MKKFTKHVFLSNLRAELEKNGKKWKQIERRNYEFQILSARNAEIEK